jgi:hypothetical protein
VWLDMTRHDHSSGRDPAEAHPGIIGLVADQDDQPLAAGLGNGERMLHQGATDPLTLKIGMHR